MLRRYIMVETWHESIYEKYWRSMENLRRRSFSQKMLPQLWETGSWSHHTHGRLQVRQEARARHGGEKWGEISQQALDGSFQDNAAKHWGHYCVEWLFFTKLQQTVDDRVQRLPDQQAVDHHGRPLLLPRSVQWGTDYWQYHVTCAFRLAMDTLAVCLYCL